MVLNAKLFRNLPLLPAEAHVDPTQTRAFAPKSCARECSKSQIFNGDLAIRGYDIGGISVAFVGQKTLVFFNQDGLPNPNKCAFGGLEKMRRGAQNTIRNWGSSKRAESTQNESQNAVQGEGRRSSQPKATAGQRPSNGRATAKQWPSTLNFGPPPP